EGRPQRAQGFGRRMASARAPRSLNHRTRHLEGRSAMTRTAIAIPQGRMIADDFIPAREGGAWLVKRGQHIRVIDVEGGQICDFLCFNADRLDERFSQARTKANQGKFTISTGDHLYSRDNNIMLTIAEDTYRDHDLQWGMCSAWVFENVRRK